MSLVDIKKVQEEATKELREEREADAKRKVKQKLKEISQAKQIVANLERELEDLYATISSGS